MEKNTIYAIVLSALVIIGFSTYQMRIQADALEAEALAAEQAAAEAVLVEESTEVAAASSLFAADTDVAAETIKEETITITTNLMNITLTNKGGDIISYELRDHKDQDAGIQMADLITNTNRAFAIALGSENAPIINDCFNVKRISDYCVSFARTFNVKADNGGTRTVTLIKQYTFLPDEYTFKLDVYLQGADGMVYSLRTSPQIGPRWDTKNRYDYRYFMSLTNGKVKRQNLAAGQTKEYNGDYSWTGVAGKYFAALVAPVNGQTTTKAAYSTKLDADDNATSQVTLVRNPISGNTVTDTYYVYLGPKTDKSLKMYNHAADNGWKLEGLYYDYCQQSSGFLTWLEVALKWIMGIIYKLVPNWGLCILIMTLLLRLALYPMTKKTSLSSVKMQQVQPKMQALQEKYKSNPDRLNQEMAALYKETGYNPMSGCLPMLIQFPIIIAMYNLFNNYFDFRGATFIPGWIPDLSQGDSVYTLGFNLPFLGNEIRLLPVIYVVIQVLQTKIMSKTQPQTAQTKSMNTMMYVMPFMFFFMFYNAPSGLVIYWTFSMVVAVIQQLFINKQVKAAREALEAEEAAKPKFVARKKK